jgi:hypothetical protein
LTGTGIIDGQEVNCIAPDFMFQFKTWYEPKEKDLHDLRVLLVNGLFDKNDKSAYKCLKELALASEQDSGVYQHLDTFIEMIDSDNSYIRTRGLLLISANAKWDADNKIDKIIDKYLDHIMDDKPITSRQCIKALPNIAKYKPDLADDIRIALNKADLEQCADSIKPLVYGDIKAALEIIG